MKRFILYAIVILALCLLGGKRRPTQLGRYLIAVNACIEKDANGTFKDAVSNNPGAQKANLIRHLGLLKEAIEELDFGAENPMRRDAAMDQLVVSGSYIYSMWKDIEQ